MSAGVDVASRIREVQVRIAEAAARSEFTVGSAPSALRHAAGPYADSRVFGIHPGTGRVRARQPPSSRVEPLVLAP